MSTSEVGVEIPGSKLILQGDSFELNGKRFVSPEMSSCREIITSLGTTVISHEFPGVGRTAHMLDSGLMILSNDASDTLSSLMVCFDAQDSSPYEALPEVPIFRGEVEWSDFRFRGGEPEEAIFHIPRIGGFVGILGVQSGNLSLSFHLKKPKDILGRRVGFRRLVLLSAEWGGLKSFPD